MTADHTTRPLDLAAVRNRVEAAMRAESERLAEPSNDRSLSAEQRRHAVEQGIGVARAMSAVLRSIDEPATAPSPVNPVADFWFTVAANTSMRWGADVERLRAVVDAAIAWRNRVAKAQRAGHRWTAGPQHWADGADVALIAAVDALDTAGTAPAAGGGAGR